jgi:hypothetical protein
MILFVFFHEHTTMRSRGAYTTTQNRSGNTFRQRHIQNLVFSKQLKPTRDHQSPPSHINSETQTHILSFTTTTREYHHYQFTNTIPSLQIQSNPHTDSHYIFIYNPQSIHGFTQNPQPIRKSTNLRPHWS